VRRIERVEREIRKLERRRKGREIGLVARFRAITALLAEWGYLNGWALTPQGERLRFVYNELDLILVEAIRREAFDGLGPADMAAVASMFTFQPRRGDDDGGWPSPTAADAGDRVFEIWDQLVGDERRHRIPETRSPEAGFAALAHGWTAGNELEDLFDDEFAAGDFVRNCRQLVDLLRQMRDEFPEVRHVAQRAIRSVDRGIVAAGGRL